MLVRIMPLLGSRLLPQIRIANPWRQNGTWAEGPAGTWVNTPGMGAELLTDGGLEAWTSATNLTHWTEGVAGASTVNQETSLMRSGSAAARLNIDGSNSQASVGQAAFSVSGAWYVGSAWARGAAGTPAARLQFSNFTTSVNDRTLSTTYQQMLATGRASAANVTITLNRFSAANLAIIYDDCSLRQLTANTLHILRPGASARCNLTVTAGTQAGIMFGANDPLAPTKFAILFHNGTNLICDEYNAGVWTNKLNTAVAYSAAALIEPVPVGSNQWQCWYNGSNRGTVTLNDATGGNAGGFSTYSGNTLANLVTT